MANIEELDFKLILDDTEFNQKIQKVKQEAEQLNAAISDLMMVKTQSAHLSKTSADSQARAIELAKKQQVAEEIIRQAKEKTAQAAAKSAVEQQKVFTETQKTQQAATRAATELQHLAEAHQRVATEAAKTATAEERQRAAVAQREAAELRLMRLKERQTSEVTKQSRLMSQIGGLAASVFSIYGGIRILENMVRITGEFEMQRVSLRNILQDAAGADHIFNQIKELAVVSPFSFKDLVGFTKQLSAFSVPLNELYDTTKMLADVSAGLGVDMSRIVLAYGQIRSASFLRGQEVRQLTEAGIPILQELQRQFQALGEEGITVGQVFDKISKRLVPFEMVEKAFKQMTSEGGKFYNMQEVQAATLQGKITNLTDAFDIMFSEIGSKFSPAIKNSLDLVRSMAENWQKLSVVIGPVIGYLSAFISTWMVWRAVEKTTTGLKAIATFIKLTKEVSLATAAMKAFSTTSKAALAGSVVGIIAAIAAGVAAIAMNVNALDKSLNNIATSKFWATNEKVKGFEKLLDAVKNTTIGTDEHREAVDKLNQQYGDYLTNLIAESDSLDVIAEKTKNVTEAIYNRARAYAYEEGMQEIAGKYDKDVSKYSDQLIKELSKIGIAEEAASEFTKNFIEALKKEGKEGNTLTIFDETFKRYFGYNNRPEDFWPVAELAGTIQKETEAIAGYERSLDILFSEATFRTDEERKAVAVVNDEIDKQKFKLKQALDAGTIGLNEYNKKVKELDLSKWERLAQIYQMAGDFDNMRKALNSAQTLNMTDWRNQINALSKNSFGGRYGAKDEQSAADYIENLVSMYKGLKKDAETLKGKDAFSEELKSTNAQLAEMDRLGKELNIDFAALTKETTRGTRSRAERNKQLVDALKAQVSELEKQKALYEKLHKYLTDDQIKNQFGSLFTSGNFNFDERIQSITAQLRLMGNEGIKAADALEKAVTLKNAEQKAKDMEGAIKSLKDYESEMRKWLTEDFNLIGTGVTLDLSKILRDLSTNQNKVDEFGKKLDEMLTKAMANLTPEQEAIYRGIFGNEFWDAYVRDGKTAIDRLAKSEKESNRQIAEEKVRDLAGKWVEEQLKENDIVLSDWGDKSLAQIREIKDKLMNLMSASTIEGLIPDALVDKAESLGIDLDTLVESIEKILGSKVENTTQEELKKIASTANGIISNIGSLNSAIEDVGETINSDLVKNFAEAAGFATQIADKVVDIASEVGTAVGEAAKGASTAGIIGLIVGAFTGYLQIILKQAEKWNSLAQSAANAAWEYKDALDEIERAQYETIFGADEWGLISLNYDKATEALNKYRNALNDAMADEAKWGGLDGQTFKNLQALLHTVVMIRDASSQKGWTPITFADSGQLDIEKLRRHIDILREYGDRDPQRLSKELRIELDNIVKLYEDYLKQTEEFKDSLEGIFGDLASSIADNMIDAFLRTGDALAELNKAFYGLGETIAKSMLQNILINEVLKKYTEQVNNLVAALPFTERTEWVRELGAIADAMKNDIENLGGVIDEVLQSFVDANILGRDSDTANETLANGIKSITEDTANLLASYLNAIRADVSFNKGQLTTIGNDIKQILGLLPAAPTLSDYLMQIQANTYNNAIYTQGILSRLDNVLDSSMGVTAFRTLNV